MKRKIFFYAIILIAGFKTAIAQKSNVASGGVATGAGGNVSYSIGQIDYITSSGAGGTISQGVQQPYEIFVITGITETGVNINVSAFPNPTKESITLNIKALDFQIMSYQLFDFQGKILEEKKITESTTLINMSLYAENIYLLRVLKQNKEMKTFKIIKN